MEKEVIKKQKIRYKTFGCKVNTYDTGRLQMRLKAAGLAAQDRAVHIVNTCAVTREATNEALRYVRKLKKQDPESFVVVTGCAAQVDTADFSKEAAADFIIANSHKTQFEQLLADKLAGKDSARVLQSDIFAKHDLDADGGLEEGRSRAFLKIQDGCNSFCSYCVIPFARGKSRSIPIPEIVDKLNHLYDRGFRESILTGIHIGDYASLRSTQDSLAVVSARQRKNPERYYFLEDLLREVLRHTKMPRLRLGSLEPGELSEALLEIYQDERMCPHFHMSIQSACSKTLKAMRRKYDALSVEKSLNQIAKYKPDAYVAMDVIVGFPGETEADFEETYQRLQATPWTRIHVFPYSDRPGTKSAHYDDKVLSSQIKERAARLRALSKERLRQAALAQIGQHKRVLLLGKYDPQRDPQVIARDAWQMPLSMASIPGSREDLPLEEFSVRVTGFDESHPSRLEGRLLCEWSP